MGCGRAPVCRACSEIRCCAAINSTMVRSHADTLPFRQQSAVPIFPMTEAQYFTGLIVHGHKGAAVEMHFNPLRKWGTAAVAVFPRRRGHKVLASIGGPEFKTYIVGRSKRFWLLIEPDQLVAARASVGDLVCGHVRAL